jgi:valine dehydrogenase (NAD+)
LHIFGTMLRTSTENFEHEQVRMIRGGRTELTIIVAVHSTVLGPAIGGCRLRRYPSWQDGLTDALRLSAAGLLL